MTKKRSKDSIKFGGEKGHFSATGRAAIIIAFGLAMTFIIFVLLYFNIIK